MTKKQANAVYDLLVQIGGASEDERETFVYNHTEARYLCTEWRFCGVLGFGGKYRSERNRVDCYREDETPERLAVIKEINFRLADIGIEADK